MESDGDRYPVFEAEVEPASEGNGGISLMLSLKALAASNIILKCSLSLSTLPVLPTSAALPPPLPLAERAPLPPPVGVLGPEVGATTLLLVVVVADLVDTPSASFSFSGSSSWFSEVDLEVEEEDKVEGDIDGDVDRVEVG